MLPTKKNLVIVSICSLIAALILYYYFFVFVQKYTWGFCKTHYCLEVLPISDFLSITIGVIGVIALIISLDSWKIQEQFKSETEFYTSLLNNLDLLLEEVTNIHPYHCNKFNDFQNALNLYWKCTKQFQRMSLENLMTIESLAEFISYCTSSNQENSDYMEYFMMKNTKVINEIHAIIIKVTALKNSV